MLSTVTFGQFLQLLFDQGLSIKLQAVISFLPDRTIDCVFRFLSGIHSRREDREPEAHREK